MPANEAIKRLNPVGGAFDSGGVCGRGFSRDKSPKKLAAQAPPTVCRGHRLDGVLTSPGKSATIAGFEIPLAIAR